MNVNDMTQEQILATLECLRTLDSRSTVQARGCHSIASPFELTYLPAGEITRDRDSDRIVSFNPTAAELGKRGGEYALSLSRLPAEKRYQACLKHDHVMGALFPELTQQHLGALVRHLSFMGLASLWDARTDTYVLGLCRRVSGETETTEHEHRDTEVYRGPCKPRWSRDSHGQRHLSVEELVEIENRRAADAYGDLFDIDRKPSRAADASDAT